MSRTGHTRKPRNSRAKKIPVGEVLRLVTAAEIFLKQTRAILMGLTPEQVHLDTCCRRVREYVGGAKR